MRCFVVFVVAALCLFWTGLAFAEGDSGVSKTTTKSHLSNTGGTAAQDPPSVPEQKRDGPSRTTTRVSSGGRGGGGGGGGATVYTINRSTTSCLIGGMARRYRCR